MNMSAAFRLEPASAAEWCERVAASADTWLRHAAPDPAETAESLAWHVMTGNSPVVFLRADFACDATGIIGLQLYWARTDSSPIPGEAVLAAVRRLHALVERLPVYAPVRWFGEPPPALGPDGGALRYAGTFREQLARALRKEAV